MFLTIASTLVSVFGIMFIGFVMARRGMLSMDVAAGLNQFVYWVALPGMIFDILVRADTSRISGSFLAALYAAMLLNYALAFIFTSGIFRRSKSEGLMLGYMSCFPNIAFMGVAIVSFLLPGDDFARAIAGMCAFLFVVVMPSTDTALSMREHKGEPVLRLLLSLVKTLLHNPMVIMGSLGVALNLTNTNMPDWALNISGMLGSTAAPCALFAMGMVINVQLASLSLASLGSPQRHFVAHLFKLLVLPCLTFIGLSLAGVSGTLLGITTLSAGMPVGVVAYVIAEKYNVCAEDASMIILVNTMASIITIPVIITVLHALGVLEI